MKQIGLLDYNAHYTELKIPNDYSLHQYLVTYSKKMIKTRLISHNILQIKKRQLPRHWCLQMIALPIKTLAHTKSKIFLKHGL